MACPSPDDEVLDDEDAELPEVEVEVEDPDLARFQAETERLRVLVDFLHRPPCAPTAADGHPDEAMFGELTSAYLFAAQAVARLAGATGLTPTNL